MNEKILRRKVDKDNFYLVYLKTLNGHLSLTNRELSVLVELCNLQAKYLQEGYSLEQTSKYIFSKESRENIRTSLVISSFNLNNIIKSLRDKGVLQSDKRRYSINPRLFVPSTEKEYSINFKIEII